MKLTKPVSDSEKVQVFKCDGKCVKVFKDPNEPKSVALYEALTHTRVEETGYTKMPAFEEITKIDGKTAIIYDWIEGKTMAEMLDENPADADKYIEQMVDILIEIHTLRSAKISKLKDYLKRSIEGLDMIDDVKKFELLQRLESMPKHIKLCHGEFSPENIIVNDKGVFVIDWLKAKQGNASADVAKTYLNFCLAHHTEYAEKFLKLYCAKTNTAIKYVQDWLPIVAAAQLKYKKPEERELLLTWIDIADYQ